jgi:hypothetical protein
MRNWQWIICIVALIGWGNYMIVGIATAAFHTLIFSIEDQATSSWIIALSIATIYTVIVNILFWKQNGSIGFASSFLFILLTGYIPGEILEWGYYHYFNNKDTKYGIVSIGISLIGCLLLFTAIFFSTVYIISPTLAEMIGSSILKSI